MTYAMPENVTGMVDFVAWENNILTHKGVPFMMVGLMIVFWVVIFSVARRMVNDTPGAAIGASFVCAIVSILFFIAGLIGAGVVLIMIILLAVSAALIYFNS